MKHTDGIYCQRCLTVNPLGRELCVRCNTRLMLVVETSALRHQHRIGEASASPDEVALERISGVENKIGRMLDQMERVLDLMFKQTNMAHENRIALDVLVSMLAEAGVLDLKEFAERCRTFAARENAQKETAAREKLEEAKVETGKVGDEILRMRFVNAYRGDDSHAFEELIDAALAAIRSNKKLQAIKTLERAAALAPDNEPLNFFLGAYFFQINKMTLARDYLRRANPRNDEAEHWHIELLLGIACGDEGETEDAKKLLQASWSVAPNFAASFALGRISALEGEWTAALDYFKRALNGGECAETHYAVGLAALHLKRSRLALRHLQNAVEIDANYSQAFYLLGFAHLLLKQRARAIAVWRRAFELAGDENLAARYRTTLEAAMKPNGLKDVPSARTAFGMSDESQNGKKHKRRGQLAGGDERLAQFLIKGALESTAAAR